MRLHWWEFSKTMTVFQDTYIMKIINYKIAQSITVIEDKKVSHVMQKQRTGVRRQKTMITQPKVDKRHIEQYVVNNHKDHST